MIQPNCEMLTALQLLFNALANDVGTFLTCCRGTNQGTLWAVHRQPGGHLVAYSGADGVVGCFDLLPSDNYRSLSMRQHTALAGRCTLAGLDMASI